MKKFRKNLARKILCGLLAAGVVGVSGSALAESYLDATGANKTTHDNISVEFTGTANSILGIDARNGNIAKVDGSKIDLAINATKNNQNGWGVYTYSSDLGGGNVFLGKDDSVINIKVTADQFAMGLQSAGLPKKTGSYVEINGKELNVVTHSNKSWTYGLNIANNSTPNSIGNGTPAKMVINADKTFIKATTDANKDDALACGIVVMSQGELEINGDLEVIADNAIVTRGNSKIVINKDGNNTVKLNGDISFDYDAATSGTPVNADVNIKLTGADSYWNGSNKIAWGANADGTGKPTAEALTVDTFTLTIADNATWNPNYFATKGEYDNSGNATSLNGVISPALNNVILDNGIINLTNAKDQVKIENIEGSGTVEIGADDNALGITKKNDADLTVTATQPYAEKIASNDMSSAVNDLAAKVKDETNADGKTAASSVYIPETTVAGAVTADIGEDGKATNVKEAVNETNAAVSDLASISLMTWRQENNDMNKRLGELRDSKGEHGAWARMARGESKYGAQNVKNQYNYYQVGYDEKLSVDPNWTVGVALTRTEGNSTFATGTGENKHTGFAFYGSYLGDNGSFIDLIAKYARMDNDFNATAGIGNGDYKTNGYSLSAEYGKRFTKDNGFWIEPQVELTYGKVGSVDYLTSKGVNVHQDGMDSLVGRLGFSLGKNIKQGNVYVRASYLYDFDGDTKVNYTNGTVARSFEQDLGGGWWEVGVGTNLNLSEATHLYFDVEKTYGGNVATPWQWNAGVRWSF